MSFVIVPLMAFLYSSALFCIGRAAVPHRERLPLAELDNAGLVHTVARGWALLGSHRSTERVVEALHR